MSDDDAPKRAATSRRMASEVQTEHRVLHEMPPELLREIPLVEPGTRLERRRDYLDLHDPARAGFRSEGYEVVKPGQRMVSRADVSEIAWSELCAACDRVVRRPPLRRAG